MRYVGLAVCIAILGAVVLLTRPAPPPERTYDEITEMWDQIWPAAVEVGAEMVRIDRSATMLVFPDVIWGELTESEQIGFVQGAQHTESRRAGQECLIVLVLTEPDNKMVAVTLPDGTVLIPRKAVAE